MSIFGKLKPKGESGFGYTSTAEDVTNGLTLDGKTILITGCNSGLGREAMRVLSDRGARVIGTARTKEKADHACIQTGNNTQGIECELADPESVNKAVDSIIKNNKNIDAIICNAGIMALPKPAQAFGYELQFFTNHIGHFILVNGLLNTLSDNGRVVVLSSAAHTMAPPEGIQFDNLSGEKNYKPWVAYGQSKFANLLFAKELSRKLSGTGKTSNAVHPGVIKTNLGRHMSVAANLVFGLASPLFLKSVAEGAATEVYAAVHPAMANKSGYYLADCNIARHRKDADNAELAARLWEKSEEIVKKLL